jgi:hypothetical protein|nr:MAG TPA: hypothetical protein [Caudoviricetes sp.]
MTDQEKQKANKIFTITVIIAIILVIILLYRVHGA